MTVFRKKNPESVPAGWRTCHVVLYAATGALGFAASVVYYLVVIRSHYRCYQYNEVQTVYERPGDAYTLHWTDRRVWYRNGNCYDAFAFPLALSVSSAAWTGVCLAFGRGGSGSSGREHDEFFRSVVGSPAASAPSEIPSLRGRSYVFFSIFFLFLFLLPPPAVLSTIGASSFGPVCSTRRATRARSSRPSSLPTAIESSWRPSRDSRTTTFTAKNCEQPYHNKP